MHDDTRKLKRSNLLAPTDACDAIFQLASGYLDGKGRVY